MKKSTLALALSATSIIGLSACAITDKLNSTARNNTISYSEFPITLTSYTGDNPTSVSYKGQIARHLLHNSLKTLAKRGDGTNAAELEAEMLAYYSDSEDGRAILSPVSKEGFPIKQTLIDDLSSGKNLSGKTYSGTITGWPGNLSGTEVIEFMIKKAAQSQGGYDPLTGYDYPQLISKFVMGAVFYNQAVDNYLDEKLSADQKPNDAPYKEGAPYTGKEHVWDEAFGYFGVPAHTVGLSAADTYAIAKSKADAFDKADANKDGIVDLYTEMTYAHGYYAANIDKSGKSNYLHTITGAFIEGRQLITDAQGQALTPTQLEQLQGYAAVISSNWEKVIAEATFKYAGAVYKDLQALEKTVADNGDAAAAFRQYAKHWSELKGFSLALQMGKNNLGAVATQLNKLIGFSPVLLGNTQVSAINSQGEFVQSGSESMTEYRLHMLKVQKLLADSFDLKARNGDLLAELENLLKSLGGAGAETD